MACTTHIPGQALPAFVSAPVLRLLLGACCDAGLCVVDPHLVEGVERQRQLSAVLHDAVLHQELLKGLAVLDCDTHTEG